jgi:peptide/nickel transport system permease protein
VLAFALRRLLISIPVLIAASFFAFTIVYFSGDPLGALRANPHVPSSVFKARAHALYLDRPFWQRYWHWMSNFFTGDFGKDVSGREVRPQIHDALLITMRLVVFSVIVAVVLAVVVGIISALRQYTVTDYSVTVAAFVFLAMPTFWFAALLQQLAIKFNENVGWFHIPVFGDSTVGLTGPWYTHIGDYLSHLILPTITLALLSFASWSRYMRASLIETRSTDYVRLARSKGLSRSRVLVRHSLRNSLIPLATIVAVDTAGLLSGVIVTETIFQWQGLGMLVTSGVTNIDANVTLAGVMVTGVIVVIANLAADLLYAVLDPRIRNA